MPIVMETINLDMEQSINVSQQIKNEQVRLEEPEVENNLNSMEKALEVQ